MLNLVVLKGNMTADAEVKTLSSGKTVANFSIAVPKGFDKDAGVSFIECTAFEKTAENIAKYFGKGSPIVITGSLYQNVSTRDDGSKRYYTSVTVNGFEFCGSNQKDGDAPASAPASTTTPSAEFAEEDDDEDILF